jgi:alpha-amylase/alpha-mannosidase (GH57 family)
MEKYVCIHGHFYQPPRENPWLEEVELQDSAYPYHDWNERISAECYGPNGTARILDGEGRIIKLINNYAWMSFNFGPTLLAWLKKHKYMKYQLIIEADRESRERFGGHGSAIAQVYNHMILPLANLGDKRTQVIWGIKDFEYRFQRKPEGMWLSETAVDLQTLDILAENGIKFTILSPNQASRVRPIGEARWNDVSGSRIDPTAVYRLSLPSGRKIALFFYDGPISQAVAFEDLLSNGSIFVKRLKGAFSENRKHTQLVHVATDGESYGHHHRHGEMALAYALNLINSDETARLTNYGEFLEKNPPTYEVEIFENSSWSCPHGVERWRSDCGCCSGGYPNWNQAWRKPLRRALDWLRDTLTPAYKKLAGSLLKDPWGARNDYIDIVLERSPERIDEFLKKHESRSLDEYEKVTVLKLMELQRHAMLMYTSCGWFFDELSGIETVQIIQYAGRAAQLANDLFPEDYQSRFLELLEQAKSNIPEHRDGRRIFAKWIEPTMLDLIKVGTHYAISSLFEDYGEETSIDSYSATRVNYRSHRAGRVKLAIGQARIRSEITYESEKYSFGVLHLGDHNINCGIGPFLGQAAYKKMERDVCETFDRADFPETIRRLDNYFGASTYSITSLFQDEQRKVVNLIMEPTLNEAESTYAQFYEHHAPLIRFLKSANMPMPKIISTASEFVVNARLKRAFGEEVLGEQDIRWLLEEAQVVGVQWDTATLEYAFRLTLERMATRLLEFPWEFQRVHDVETAVSLLDELPFEVNTWKAQNIVYEVLEQIYPETLKEARRGNEDALEWSNHFKSVAEKLKLLVPE